MRNDKDWRKFEQLVALIEAQAAPRGAVVKSPDRIRDLVTGRLREVDASIRQRVGTTEILVTIECRKRSRIADDQWIEQLASKRQKIGAAKTIAVSASGFTRAAQITASQHGIDVRVLSEVKATDIDAWLSMEGAVHLFREIEDVSCEVVLPTEGNTGESIAIDAYAPLFFHRLMASPFPAVVFLQFLEMTQPNRFWSVPLDGTRTRLSFELDGSAPDLIPVPLGRAPRPERGVLEIESDGQRRSVQQVRVSALVSYHAAVFSRDEGQHFSYQTTEGPGVQHTVFQGQAFDLPVRFDHQFGPGDARSVKVRFGIPRKPRDA